MKIKSLLKLVGIDSKVLVEDFEITGISCNSKQVKPGYIFVAIKGAREDGSKFIDEAVSNGAKIIISSCVMRHASCAKIPLIKVKDIRKVLGKLAAQFYGRPSQKIKMIGVTGTNGKTTITYLIEAILKKAKFHPAVIGTINYRFKNKVFVSKNTTPGPVDIQSMLAQMLKRKITHCVMEVSSHALDQDRVQAIDFNSAIFTNLTQDHLDYHRTINNYFKSKLKLFSGLNKKSFAILNIDDKYGRQIKKRAQGLIITYGIDGPANFRAEDIKSTSKGTEFNLATPKGKINIKSSLIGRHNVYNILAAAAWASTQGIRLELIKSAIKNFSNVPGRLERIKSDRLSIFVDYAHTEDALKNILLALRPITENRLIVVFGCGGQRDKAKRPKMGNIVTQLADFAIVTNDNPRDEDPGEIIQGIKSGISKDNYCIVPERFQAIKKSLLMARSGDIVVVAGKGHENYQIIKEKVIHFDDREAIRKCLKYLKS